METTSSVYMCFPCYQEFNSLDEVLQHQLTCTAETTDPLPTTPGADSISVPLLQTQQHVVASSNSMIAPLIQTQSQILYSASKDDGPLEAETEMKAPSSSDQPRILYQCGDCDKLFKSLYLWQEHRKDSACLKPPSETDQDSDQVELHLPIQPKSETEFDPEPEPDPDPDLLQEGETDIALPEVQEEVQDPTASTEVQAPDVAEDDPSAQTSNALASESCPLSASDTEESTPRKRGANKKPKPEPVLLCVDCGSSFGLVSELVAHRKTQHGLEEALHRCLVCGESFLNTTLFLYHRKQHRQQGEEKQVLGTAATAHSPMAVQEEVVEESIVEMSGEFYTLGKGAEDQGNDVASSAAAASVFAQAEMFMCTQCGAAFTKEAAFASHRKEKHGLAEALHCCVQCDQSFMNTTQYLFHRRQHHPKPGTVAKDDRGAAGAAATPQAVPKSSKRVLLSPTLASDSDSPLAKKSRTTISITSMSTLKENNCEASPVKEEKEGGDSGTGGADLPPPAKLMQDWARTPLPHVCPHCGKTFTRRIFLRAHVYSHTGEKLFTCKVCKKAFTNSQSLLRHSMTHMGNKPFSCDVCDKNFSQAATLKRHQRTHTSTQPRRKRGRKPVCTLDSEGAAHLFSCPHCPSRFITEEQLTHHKLLHTSHPFRCKVCAVAFKRRKELDLHSLSHQDKEPVPCPHCAAQFINQSVLDIHMQRCPTTEEEKSAGRGRGQGRGRCTGQIECDLCGHRCMTQEGLDLHRLSHTGQTPLKCPVTPCRRRFASNAALEEHVLAHCQGTLSKARNRPRFRCQFCSKDFAYISTFNVHMRTHTDERPFECTTCHKRFRQLPHLQDHERIHSGLRPFCCWVCGKSFSVAARLTEHARTHSGEKPYPCPRCPSAFRSRSNLDKHIRLHGDQPAEQAAQAQEVVEGAKVLTSLAATADGSAGTVQTFYLLQGAEGATETVMIPSDQIAAGASQVVILPSSVMGGQTIAVPTIAVDGGQITVVEGGQDSQHTIEFIVEETV